VSNPWENQRGGAIHGTLPDGSNQVRIHVSVIEIDAAEKLRRRADVRASGEHEVGCGVA
jgi:hypothetical protein